MPRRYCARERADRVRRLQGLAVAVLTAPGERDGAVRDTERRAGEALPDNDCRGGPVAAADGRAMRQWRPPRCGRYLGYANSLTTRQAAAADERPTHALPGHSNSDQAAHRCRRCGRSALHPAGWPWEDDAFTERAMLTA